MILSSLDDSKRVETFHSAFTKLFDYVRAHWQELLNAEDGRVELDGDRLFINKMTADGEPAEQRPLELHREYIDVHILLDGRERIGWKALKALTRQTQDFAPGGDIAFYADTPTAFVDLLPGQFAVIYPEDPHAPLIGSGKIKKLIAKIKL